MSASFSSFDLRSLTYDSPTTPRRSAGGQRVPPLASAWFVDPQSSPTGTLRTATPTRAATPRHHGGPCSPMYRSSAVFGTGSRVATPIRRVSSPRGSTPSSPSSASFMRVNSGTPSTPFHRTNSGSMRFGTSGGGTPQRLFADEGLSRRPATPIQLRASPHQHRATTPIHARASRHPPAVSPLDTSTAADTATSSSFGVTTATDTSFVSSPPSSLRGGAAIGVRDVAAARTRAAAPATLGESAFQNFLKQQQQQQRQHQLLPVRDLTTASSVSSPRRHLQSTVESVAMLSSIVERWNDRYSENQNNYREGGYMAVAAGEVLKGRYVMLQKLGWGEFSTVWLAFDKSPTLLTQAFVAIKIAKCSVSVGDSTKYEISLLNFLRESLSTSVPLTHLLDSFEHKGSYGTHQCFVMSVHGSNMLCVVDHMKARRRRRTEKEVCLIKEVTASVLRGLEQLENHNVIHTDLKPENVLCSAPDPKVVKMIERFLARNPKLGREALDGFATGNGSAVVLADFGLSVLLEPAAVAAKHCVGSKRDFRVHVPGIVSNSTGTLIQTREYRAPEILFGADFNARTDVWSLGCMTFELITGDFLVDPKRKTRDEREMDIEHLAMIMQIIGPVPHRIACSARGPGAPKYIHRYFNEQGHFLYAEKYKRYPRRSLAAELELFLEPSEAERAAQFIMSCFTYDPMERCNASDLLKHSWLK